MYRNHPISPKSFLLQITKTHVAIDNPHSVVKGTNILTSKAPSLESPLLNSMRALSSVHLLK